MHVALRSLAVTCPKKMAMTVPLSGNEDRKGKDNPRDRGRLTEYEQCILVDVLGDTRASWHEFFVSSPGPSAPPLFCSAGLLQPHTEDELVCCSILH